LKMEPGYPVLTSVRTAYDTAGRPIEYGSYSYPAEADGEGKGICEERDRHSGNRVGMDGSGA
jgi:hypothetical protein